MTEMMNALLAHPWVLAGGSAAVTAYAVFAAVVLGRRDRPPPRHRRRAAPPPALAVLHAVDAAQVLPVPVVPGRYDPQATAVLPADWVAAQDPWLSNATTVFLPRLLAPAV